MSYCPQCRLEYKQGVFRCPDCDVDLVAVLPPEEKPQFDENIKTVLLCTITDMMSATMLEEALKSQGIPCLLKSGMGHHSNLMAINQAMKGYKIYVSESELEKALVIAETIIPDLERSDDDK